jgi:WD40 repeat protein
MQHKITNFEYLMHLNITAGRTFNDLAQYPVFPWVLSDYTSPRIDLRDPKFFRNFQWPMGAQVDSQRQLLQEKYEASASLQDDEVLPYHTGSHYSTAAMVIWYLIRMEPFTSFHVWLQDGKFDRPDRLFHSIDSTWRGCTSNPQDVKELIPEFFFNPEFLENVNDISFGTRQNGRNIDNVDMPAWCKDASDFVRINREALESDYVSRNLHHWIDLVFGHKQRPPHLIGGSELAVDACNAFVHLTYPDAVNLEEIKITDEVLYERTIRQIDNYGQTPVQLFDRAHPERLPIDRVDIIWPIASVVTGVDTMPRAATAALQQQQQLDKPSKVLCYGDFKVSASPVLLIAVCGGVLEKLVVVDSTRVIGYHGFQVRQPDIVPPFSLKIDKSALLVSASVGRSRRLSSYLNLQSSGHTKEKLAGVPFASHGVLSQSQQAGKLSACLSDFDYARIGTAGNKASFLEEEHQSRVKSVENDRRFQHSKSVASSKDASPKMRKSRSAVNLSSEISGESVAEATNKAGTGVVGRQINRRERVDEHLSCNLYALLPDSKLLFSCAHWDNSFKVTAVDSGRLIQSVSHHREVVTCLAVASDFGRHWLVTGSKDCIVIVWELCPEKDCEPITPIPLHILYGHDDSVNCVAVSPELDLIVSGSDDGTVIIHTLREGTYLRSILIGISQSMYAKAVSSLLHNSGQKESSSPTPAKLSSSTSHASISSATSKRSATGKSPRSEIPQIYKRRVQLVVITKEGYLVTYSPDGNLLSTHTMNGRYVKMVDVKERLHAMCLSEDGKVLITGGERCLVVIRWVNNLTLANNGPRKDLDSVIDGSHDQEHAPFSSPIRSLYLTAQERHLVVGLESGHIRILAQVRLLDLFVKSSLYLYITFSRTRSICGESCTAN